MTGGCLLSSVIRPISSIVGEGGDEGYYSSSEEEGEMTEEMAAKGLGEAGSVNNLPLHLEKLHPR